MNAIPTETVARFEAYQRRNPMAIERVLAFARAKQAAGETDVVLSGFSAELGIDRAVLPSYARLAVERDPTLDGVLQVRPYVNRIPKKSTAPPGTGYKAMWSLRPWLSATNLSREGQHAERLANDAEDAADAGDEKWTSDALRIIEAAKEELAQYELILVDPQERRRVAGR